MGLVHLYIDDSGTRRPDTKPDLPRHDGIDHFALGGILIDDGDVDRLIDMHQQFRTRWDMTYPLHSTKVRGRRGPFAWLGSDKSRAEDFLCDLEGYDFVSSRSSE